MRRRCVTLHRITTKDFLTALGGNHHGCGVAETQRTVLFALGSRPDRIFPMEDLIDIAYGGDAEGGPADPPKNITVALGRLRRRGFKIKTHYNRGYQLAA